jgi:predicted nucleic acid-binding protein
VKKVVLDTNLYIDWINRGLRQERMVGAGLIRYLSAVVVMELRAGAQTPAGRAAVDRLVRAYAACGRLIVPAQAVFDRAGSALRRLELAGRPARSAAFVNDLLIALTARMVGATVVTANARGFEAIRQIAPFELEDA